MFAHLHRQGTQPRAAAPPAGTRLRRIAAVLAAVTTGLLSSAASASVFGAGIIFMMGGSCGAAC